MKKKTTEEFVRRFRGNRLEIELPGDRALNIPLDPRAGGATLPTRKWRARQGGAQAKLERAGGFVAVDWRAADSCFHWRGRFDQTAPLRLAIIDALPIEGWTMTWPGFPKPIRVDRRSRLEFFAGASEGFGPDMPKPRWLYFEPSPAEGVEGNGASASGGADKKAIEPGSGWMISCAGLTPSSGVEFILEDGCLSVCYADFDNRAGGGRFDGPYLVLGLSSPQEAAEAHVKLTGKEGYWRPERQPRPWWRLPTLYLSSARLERLGEETGGGSGAADKLLAALDGVARRFGGQNAPEEGAILGLDLGWCDALGDWNPHCPGLFENFEEWIAFRQKLRDRGHRVLLTFAPFLAAAESDLAREEDWALLRDTQGRFVQAPGGDSLFLDCSSKPTLDLLADTTAYLLEESLECLGADGLILEPLLGPANQNVIWNDPNRAVGENLWGRALHRIAEAAREARPDCLLECAAGDPCASRAANRFRLSRVFASSPDETPLVPPSNGLLEPETLLPGVLTLRLLASLAEAPPPGAGPVGFIG
jgi:hypothetical protein